MRVRRTGAGERTGRPAVVVVKFHNTVKQRSLNVDVNGAQVAQVLRVSLDGGSQLNQFQAFYRGQSGNEPLAVAVGLKKVKDGQKEFNAERGRLTIWEPMSNDLGMQGLAILVNPAGVEGYGGQTQSPRRVEAGEHRSGL